MINEPEFITYLRGYNKPDQTLDVLFEYIDQLQGLLSGTLMLSAEGIIVPRVPIVDMQSGDLWYTPITYGGPEEFSLLAEDIDE